jgi:hypothetical protein
VHEDTIWLFQQHRVRCSASAVTQQRLKTVGGFCYPLQKNARIVPNANYSVLQQRVEQVWWLTYCCYYCMAMLRPESFALLLTRAVLEREISMELLVEYIDQQTDCAGGGDLDGKRGL